MNNVFAEEFINKDNIKCVRINGAENFSPEDIFESGQCFRWNKISSQHYEGIAYKKYIRVLKSNNLIIIENADLNDYKNIWYDYFDIGRDYGKITEDISADPVVRRAVGFCPGLRILRQEPFETLISFIISQNNNIPRIKKIIDSLCSYLGTEIYFNGKTHYTFPSPDAINNAGMGGLESIRAGFRNKYIYNAVELINKNIIDLAAVYNMNIENGEKYLSQIKGVGPKVSACVLLFAYNKLDAFPIDVWVRRILNKYYPESFSPSEYFGAYAGIAGEYLFHYERNA